MEHRLDQVTNGLDDYFRISIRGSSLGTEIRAGTASFLTMSYILLVNPQVLAVAGFSSSDVVFATAIASCCGCILSGLLSNLPLGLAPGLGLSAYLSYGLVQGGYTVPEALTACFVAALINIVLAVVQVSDYIVRYIPECVKMATVVGMGFLLTLIGLDNIQFVVKDENALLKMGDFSQTVILAFAGLILLALLHHWNVKGGIIIGISVITLVSWGINNTWPHTIMTIPSTPHSLWEIDLTLLQWKMIPAILAFLAVGIFDVSGVIYALSRDLGSDVITSSGIKGSNWAMITTACATIVAAGLGCSPIIVHLESAAGVKEGARTGFSSIICGLWFLLAIFFAPLFAAVPLEATTPVLIIVGSGMMELTAHINWSDTKQGLPAFLTIIMMPFTFSIPNGIFMGTAYYFILYILTGEFLNLFKPRVDKEETLSVVVSMSDSGSINEPLLGD